jgi:hypothetical protein
MRCTTQLWQGDAQSVRLALIGQAGVKKKKPLYFHFFSGFQRLTNANTKECH